MDLENKDKDSYKEHLSNTDDNGNRKWIYPQSVNGSFYKKRNALSLALLSIFFLTPFIKYNDAPIILFNFIERKFIFLGFYFGAQDFFIFVVTTISIIIFIVLFSAIFGRIFCGWLCPQTIFMEMVFRKIEFFIEGSAIEQRNLDNKDWNISKVFKKIIKHTIFLIISFIIANTIAAYFIGIDNIIDYISKPIIHNLKSFSAIILLSAFIYFVFANLRELVCTIICPYGRLQSVLQDKNTIVVIYDYIRGEPRGKIKKNEQRNIGDCIDCLQCVKVCPTGIDIRNGTQLECTNCTACIDACDNMMHSIGFKPGLIKYSSENNITNKIPFKITLRIKAYSAILLSLIIGLFLLLFTKDDMNVNVTRVGSLLYQNIGNDTIANLYNINITNETNKLSNLEIKLKDNNGRILMIGSNLYIKPFESASSSFFIYMPKNSIKSNNTKITLEIYNSNGFNKTINTTFLGPDNNTNND